MLPDAFAVNLRPSYRGNSVKELLQLTQDHAPAFHHWTPILRFITMQLWKFVLHYAPAQLWCISTACGYNHAETGLLLAKGFQRRNPLVKSGDQLTSMFHLRQRLIVGGHHFFQTCINLRVYFAYARGCRYMKEEGCRAKIHSWHHDKPKYWDSTTKHRSTTLWKLK